MDEDLHKEMQQLARDLTTHRWVIGGLALMGAFLLSMIIVAQASLSSNLAQMSNNMARVGAIIERIDLHGSSAFQRHKERGAGETHR